MRKASSLIVPMLFLLLIQGLLASVEAKLQDKQNRRKGIKGNNRRKALFSKMRQLAAEAGRDKNSKYETEEEEEPPRYSFPSKILSESENEFLGAQRFVGEVCLCSIDTVDFRYRSDFLVEAWDIDSSTSLGFCLDFLPASGEDEEEDRNNKDEQTTPYLTMNVCDKNAPGQRWFFTRVATRGETNDNRPGLYIIQNAASGLVLATPPDPPLFTDDKYSDKDEWYHYDDDRYVPDFYSRTGIHLTKLSRVNMEQDKILWAVNEDRFFTFQDRGLFDFFDDDIFGFFDNLPFQFSTQSDVGRQNDNKPEEDDEAIATSRQGGPRDDD